MHTLGFLFHKFVQSFEVYHRSCPVSLTLEFGAIRSGLVHKSAVLQIEAIILHAAVEVCTYSLGSGIVTGKGTLRHLISVSVVVSHPLVAEYHASWLEALGRIETFQE